MSTGVRIAIVVGAVLLALAELFVPEEDPRLSDPTTHGTMPWGFRAAYDLLVELGYPVRRHEAPVEQLGRGETAWWLQPPGVCARPRDDEPAWSGSTWVLGGGTAVVWLSETTTSRTCGLGTLAVPAREATVPPDAKATYAMAERAPGEPTRDPEIPRLVTFTEAGDWDVLVSYRGRPLVLEHGYGAGRLVVVADVEPIRNGQLDHGDAAPLLVDVVRAFGAPAIVEAPPPPIGMATRSVGRYLAHSAAAVPLAGLVLTGLLVVWRGTLVPPRTLDDGDVTTPTLGHFVESLARLYAGTHDHARLLARYRRLSASRLRRHLGLPSHATLDALVARIGRRRTLTDDPGALLDGPLRVATSDELRAAVARLDALVAEVIG